MLIERPDKARGEWRSFKLIASRRRRKRNYWFGANGERLARNTDLALLYRDEPEIYAWVLERLGLAR